MKYRIITNDRGGYDIQEWGIPYSWISANGKPGIGWWTSRSCDTLRQAKRKLKLVMLENEVKAEMNARSGQVVYEDES